MRRFFPILVCFLATTFALAGKFWHESSFLEWNRKQSLQVLQDSPWAQAQTFTTSLPTGAGTPTSGAPNGEQRTGDLVQSRQYFVRFQSASPVRMALARLQLLQNGVTVEAAQEFVQSPPFEGKVVLMLRLGTGQDPTELHNITTELLRRDTYLLLAKSKQKIYLEEYHAPGGPGGSEAIFIFPRMIDGKSVITVEEKEVRFISRISRDTRLNRKFKLQDMVFQGNLEI